MGNNLSQRDFVTVARSMARLGFILWDLCM
jgi:hypothetical protein